jgi:hypothetical protein
MARVIWRACSPETRDNPKGAARTWDAPAGRLYNRLIMAQVFISFIHEEERVAKAVHDFLRLFYLAIKRTFFFLPTNGPCMPASSGLNGSFPS